MDIHRRTTKNRSTRRHSRKRHSRKTTRRHSRKLHSRKRHSRKLHSRKRHSRKRYSRKCHSRKRHSRKSTRRGSLRTRKCRSGRTLRRQRKQKGGGITLAEFHKRYEDIPGFLTGVSTADLPELVTELEFPYLYVDYYVLKPVKDPKDPKNFVPAIFRLGEFGEFHPPILLENSDERELKQQIHDLTHVSKILSKPFPNVILHKWCKRKRAGPFCDDFYKSRKEIE